MKNRVKYTPKPEQQKNKTTKKKVRKERELDENMWIKEEIERYRNN